MTDQPTTVDRQMTNETADTETPRERRDQQGTRELRDAQRRGSGAARERPPIRAEGGARGQGNAPLFAEEAARDLKLRWVNVQTEFVDEPREAVQKADALVAEVLQSLTDTFAREREELEAGWSKSGEGSDRQVSTEDLRQAIQRYRSFFNRLLSL